MSDTRVNIVRITLELEPGQAAGLRRFAEKVTHQDAVMVLYPHVAKEIRSEQAYSIMAAFSVVHDALDDAGVATFPWIETGRV